MKIKFIIILFVFSLKLYALEELRNLISLETRKIITNEADLYPDEESRKNIENIYDRMEKFQRELLNNDKKNKNLEEEKIKMIKKVFLSIKDFNYIMMNHNIEYLSKEIKGLTAKIENSYIKIFSEDEKNHLTFGKGSFLENNFCIINIKVCNDICWRPPRIYMKNFNCNFDDKSYTCECGQK